MKARILHILILLILAWPVGRIFCENALPPSVAGPVSSENATKPLSASQVFADIPLQVLELLRPSTRLDMLDYYIQADSLWKAPNALDGYCQLQTVTDDYLSLTVSPVSTLEIKVLPFSKGESIVMTLYTVGDETTAKDTEVSFFDHDLNPISSKGIFTPPSMYDFFDLRKGSGLTKKDLEEALPFQTIEYTTGPGPASLTATFTTLLSLPKESQDSLAPHLLPPLKYEWTGKSFKR